jgi:hypothetical protein
MSPLPPTCGVSILSAGNSSISIEYDEDVEGFGVCARRSSNGTFEGFGRFGSSAMDGLSKYGNSSSGIILVGGVDARPLIRKGRFTCALGSHSPSPLLQTYLTKIRMIRTKSNIPVVIGEDDTSQSVLILQNCFVIEWNFCCRSFKHGFSKRINIL